YHSPATSQPHNRRQGTAPRSDEGTRIPLLKRSSVRLVEPKRSGRHSMCRRLLYAVGASLALAGASGCSSRAGAEAGRPVTIRYAFWGQVYEIRVWEELARRFHARQDRIRVKLEHISGQAYHPKLLAMAVGRCSPDVMAVDD